MQQCREIQLHELHELELRIKCALVNIEKVDTPCVRAHFHNQLKLLCGQYDTRLNIWIEQQIKKETPHGRTTA